MKIDIYPLPASSCGIRRLMGAALSVAARGSTPPRFSPQAPLIPSHLTMAEGDDAETQQQQQRHDDVVQGVPCHHRAQGSSVNPFGYPPLSDLHRIRGEVGEENQKFDVRHVFEEL